MQIIQVVPGLPPQTDGIGDYALKLARPLRDHYGVMSHFLVVNPGWEGGPVEGFSASSVTERTPVALVTAIRKIEAAHGGEPMPILLQFSPYGYEKRGCPFWFARGIEQLHGEQPEGIHALFHELDNQSWKPWGSAFWLSSIQRSLLKRVARVCTYRCTNTELHRRKLEDWGVGRFDLLPNFSTMLEPTEYPEFTARRKDLIIFGRGVQRRWTYERGAKMIGPLCRKLGVTRILDIGEPVPEASFDSVDGIPVVRLGRLPEMEVVAQMSTALASFTYYPLQYMMKSSIFAVSAGFGTIPVIFDNQKKPRSCPGLITGEDFVVVGDDLSGLELPPLEVLSRTVFDRYQLRRSERAAGFVASRMLGLRDATVSADAHGHEAFKKSRSLAGQA